MKPEDLKSPFCWDNRRVCIQDRIWYVPDYLSSYSDFTFPGWEHSDLFGNSNPVYVEYCSGNGAWIAEKAAANPAINWVAVEIQFVRARKIWSKIKNLDLHNLIVICGEAYCATHHYFPTGSVSQTFINFPDPWPKKRHAKHRLFQPRFIAEIRRILNDEGQLKLVTDDIDYSEMAIDEVQASSLLCSSLPAPYFISEFPNYGSSYFDQLWREKGKTIRYHQFKKLL